MRPRPPVHKTRWIAFPLALYFLEMRPKAPARPEGAQLSNPYLTVPSMDPPLLWPLPAPLPYTCSLRPCSRLPVQGACAPSCWEPSLTTLSSGPRLPPLRSTAQCDTIFFLLQLSMGIWHRSPRLLENIFPFLLAFCLQQVVKTQ